MIARIRSELSAIEREHGVRILLAVESGSRAWGFPSRDSDYDIRFIYVRPVADCLSVIAGRDVIERPIDALLDVNGWDLRKALRLLLRSNAVLLEWLSSPIRYIDDGSVPAKLRDLAETGADLRAFEYHYDHQARRSFGEIAACNHDVLSKRYCYALRAALVLRWLRDRRTPPPMDLSSLLNGLALPAELQREIGRLVDRKAGATEGDTTPRAAKIDDFIGHVLAQRVGSCAATGRADMAALADALLLSILLPSGKQRPCP